MFEAKPVIGSI